MEFVYFLMESKLQQEHTHADEDESINLVTVALIVYSSIASNLLFLTSSILPLPV